MTQRLRGDSPKSGLYASRSRQGCYSPLVFWYSACWQLNTICCPGGNSCIGRFISNLACVPDVCNVSWLAVLSTRASLIRPGRGFESLSSNMAKHLNKNVYQRAASHMMTTWVIIHIAVIPTTLGVYELRRRLEVICDRTWQNI